MNRARDSAAFSLTSRRTPVIHDPNLPPVKLANPSVRAPESTAT